MLAKDKLMQAAGRMRQLWCYQTLCFVGHGEVEQSTLYRLLGGNDNSNGGTAVIDKMRTVETTTLLRSTVLFTRNVFSTVVA